MKMWSIISLVSLILPLLAWSSDQRPRWLVELSDKSRVYIEPTTSTLLLESAALNQGASIGVNFVKTIEKNKNGKWLITLSNGDRISGDLIGESIRGKSLVGRVELSPKSIHRIEAVQKKRSPAVVESSNIPQLRFENMNWDLWRTGWELTDDNKLASARSIRPGFAYGHWANGRGGMVVTGNGDQSWTDYELAFDYKMLAANRDFFHAHIPGESRGMIVYFRAKSLSESWNQPDTGYGIAINPSGTWTLLAYDGWHIPGNGWNSGRKGTLEKLATGKLQTRKKDISEGRLFLNVKGNRFKAWIHNDLLFDYTHDSGEVEPITFGGFGVQWRYESMGWIKNLTVQKASHHAGVRL